jgi:hypothetical protein
MDSKCTHQRRHHDNLRAIQSAALLGTVLAWMLLHVQCAAVRYQQLQRSADSANKTILTHFSNKATTQT